MLNVAQIIPVTEAEGPGKRFALWLQGCPLRCPGCCNPEMLPFERGQTFTVAEVFGRVQDAQRKGIEGITLLGGEPFAQAGPAASLARRIRAVGLSVMVFSGFTLAELQASSDPAVAELLAATDILIDGPFLRDRPETRRRWIGSANQQIHFLTDRCSAEDVRWQQPNTLEIRLTDGTLMINGFPAKQAAGLWRRLDKGITP
jgi:anaerobic ribonucleoside-triphosphate reductase activating protein